MRDGGDPGGGKNSMEIDGNPGCENGREDSLIDRYANAAKGIPDFPKKPKSEI
jgi:hypothetical protein